MEEVHKQLMRAVRRPFVRSSCEEIQTQRQLSSDLQKPFVSQLERQLGVDSLFIKFSNISDLYYKMRHEGEFSLKLPDKNGIIFIVNVCYISNRIFCTPTDIMYRIHVFLE